MGTSSKRQDKETTIVSAACLEKGISVKRFAKPCRSAEERRRLMDLRHYMPEEATFDPAIMRC